MSRVTVRARVVDRVIAAAIDSSGECIFLEDDKMDESDDSDIVDAELVDPGVDP